MIRLGEKDGGLVLSLRVQPRSSRNALCGEYDGALKVRLKAPPVDDAANRECCRFLAKMLGVAASQVVVMSGHTSRTKRIFVDGLTPHDSLEKLSVLVDDADFQL